MGKSARSRRSTLALLLLWTLFFKWASPALGHALPDGHGTRAPLLVAICTTAGLKYIAWPATTAQDVGQETPLSSQHNGSAEHCAFCSGTGHDGVPPSTALAHQLFEQGATARFDLRSPCPTILGYWRSANPRAPPVQSVLV